MITSIFLGAISAGLWEYFLEPLLLFLRQAILNPATLLVPSLKNAIYIEISKGFHGEVRLDLLVLFLLIVLGFLIVAITAFFTVKSMGIIRSMGMGKKVTTSPILSPMLFIISFYFLLLLILGFTVIIRVQYINNAITHFHQLCAIVSPYIEDTKKKKYASRFAQIQSKEDYSNLISELESIALDNKQTIPKFNIW